MGQGLAVGRFSTAHLREAERHEAWTQRDWPSLAPVFRTRPTEPFDVDSTGLRLDGLGVNFTRISGQRWTRDAGMLRSYDADALTVAITETGTAVGEMAGKPFRTGPGCVHFHDLSMPSDHVSTASRTILITVPRQRAEQAGLDVRRANGWIVDQGPATLISPFVTGLLRGVPHLAGEEASRLARILLDLLAVAAAPSIREARLPGEGRQGIAALAARHEIETALGSPILSVAYLCRRLGVSRSTLHRLFEPDGGIQAYIRSRRLEVARAALAEPGNIEPIHAIADRLAFSDAAHLSRLFRARYGLSPRDFRMEVRAQAARAS